jgi:UDP-glucose 4-epimerase
VLDVVRAFEKACGKRLPYTIGPRRAGDIAEFYADVSLAASALGWTAQRSLEVMCADSWRWQSDNPNGFRN